MNDLWGNEAGPDRNDFPIRLDATSSHAAISVRDPDVETGAHSSRTLPGPDARALRDAPQPRAPAQNGVARNLDSTRAAERKSDGVDIGGFFKVPNRLFGSGLAAKLGVSVTVVYVSLCDVANRKGSRSFSVSDETLSADTGLGKSTIRSARKTLAEAGLISYAMNAGSSAEYSLKTPEMKWNPVKNRKRTPKKPRGRAFEAAAVRVHPQSELPECLRGTGANYARPYRP